jgi:hypothetical protein
MKHVAVGDRVVVFDYVLYLKAGGRDIGDNSQFWKEATVVAVYWYHGQDLVADVRFDHRPDKISKAHFVWGIRQGVTSRHSV